MSPLVARKTSAMTLTEARVLRDGLLAGLVTRDQWCALVVRWLDDVEVPPPWMLDMLYAEGPEGAADALMRGWPDLPDVAKDEDATEREPWPLLGFLYLRHERGLSLWELLEEAIRWCRERYYYTEMDELERLRKDYDYCYSTSDEPVSAEEEEAFERRARAIFERHRRAAAPWWEALDGAADERPRQPAS